MGACDRCLLTNSNRANLWKSWLCPAIEGDRNFQTLQDSPGQSRLPRATPVTTSMGCTAARASRASRAPRTAEVPWWPRWVPGYLYVRTEVPPSAKWAAINWVVNTSKMTTYINGLPFRLQGFLDSHFPPRHYAIEHGAKLQVGSDAVQHRKYKDSRMPR